MTLIDDYLSEQITYEKKYGNDTIVLMQVGHFYEAYAVDNEIEKTNSANLYRLSDIMNIQMTRKNKSISDNSRGNPLMIGVNIYSIDKFVQILLNANYTIVIIDQTSPPPYVKREVTNIYSPGTNIQYNLKGDTNNLVSIYLENINSFGTHDRMCVGMSAIDLSTGNNIVYECYSQHNDYNYALDEVFRFIQVYDPKELVFNIKNSSQNNLCKEELSNYLDLSQRVVHFNDLCNQSTQLACKEYFKISYQNAFLKRIFPNTGLLSVIEYLDLEHKNFATISYLFLLNFAYEHSEHIVKNICKPELWEQSKYLSLTNNTINQLNLVSHNSVNINTKFNSLYAVINNTSTPIGKRFLRDRLLNPILDKKKLNTMYNNIENMMMRDSQGNNIYKSYETYLSKILDLERLHRKIALGIIQPADFAGLDMSYENVIHLLDSEYNQLLKPNQETINEFKNFVAVYNHDFNINEIVKYHLDKINSSFFNRNIYQDIDNLQDSIDSSHKFFQDFITHISNIIEKNTEKSMVKLEHNDRDGYYLTITAKRSALLKTKLKNIRELKINGKVYHKNLEFKSITKTATKITCDYLKETSNNLRIYQEDIKTLCRERFLEKVSYYDQKYMKYLKDIANYIGNIDVVKSCAKSAILYGYTRPIICDSLDDTHQTSGYISATDLRHPIIERLHNNIGYIPNDVVLGEHNQQHQEESVYGMLLFGTNASGKSSLMKAIGLNVILAQCGFFVAATKFVYMPYHHIFSRINNNDNIFKGESSFAVEMSELRSILKRANNKSLILGDELCSGTESISALSIFSASVIKLYERKSSFIFATHLHELCNIQKINNLNGHGIRMCHLKVIYDPDTGKLIYDRKLEEGNGQAIYGLEVCKAMDMDNDFLVLSEEIRKNLLGVKNTILEDKTSHYNSNVYIHECKICGNPASDVHHIKFQCQANQNNIIDNYLQKDSVSNLVQLCEKCHDQVHNGNLNIYGYQQTSNGIELNHEILDKNSEKYQEKHGKRKKLSEEQIEIIKELAKNHKLTQQQACLYLKKNHNIEISKGTLSKVVRNKY